MSLTPLAIFTYNRPQHARQLLNSLANCSRLEECRVIIFSDAPRIPEHVEGVKETRRLVHEWAKKNQAQVVERSENLGLARSIVSGVTKLCDEFGRVIVLEDDMIVHHRFIDYMLSALDLYEDDEIVCQISGYMFPVWHASQPDAFFLPLTTTWGWATWQRAWVLFQWDVSNALSELQELSTRRAFDLDGTYPYSKMLEDCIAGKNDSWGIRWWWAAFNAGKIILHPRHSLVWVGGFDGTGTHNGVNKKMASISPNNILNYSWSHPFRFPLTIAVYESAMKKIKQYLLSANKTSQLSRLRVKFFGLLKKWKACYEKTNKRSNIL